MAFQTILVRWRKSGRVNDADRVEAALHAFRLRHEQAFVNLDTDAEISQGKRSELIEQLLLVDVYDDKLVDERVFAFCRVHQCQGRRSGYRAALGHVEERSKTERTLESTAFGPSPLVRKRRSAVLFVDSLLVTVKQ